VGKYKTVIIDEVQRIQNAGLLLKILADNFKNVQFIATGSSALDISESIFEPLTGRYLLFHLYPFTLAEIYKQESVFEIENRLPFHLVYGNYPDIYKHQKEAETLLKNLSNQYLYKDVLVWKDIRKPQLLDKLLKLLSYQVGSEVSIHELSNQLQVSSETIDIYINLLEKSFVLFRLPAYSTNPRKEVSKMNKIFFWDNGIRNAVIGNYDDLSIRQDVGQLWENFVISERMKMNSWLAPDRKGYFWRNYNQSEVDYVEIEGNQLSAFEMKWNTHKNHSVTRAFTNAYPDASTEVITSISFDRFCEIK
ncbi:MAG: ATP-binding protein, partial [Brumimicrobium sp.]